ncbi:flavin-containing monooxygenase 1 [Spatholobus suberectus]|nr:flavin-containing monooxygenase 1 [Spatholobus suberectus]
MKRKVGIIGAGISGLLACKYVRAKGFDPIVFEAKSSMGGVWTKTLATTKLQTPKASYQFSDFPWPSSVTQVFPNHHQVLDYITSYAHHFDLLKHIRFNSQVQGIDFECEDPAVEAWHLWGGTGEAFSSKGKWTLSVKNTQKDSTELSTAIYASVCGAGRFSDVPNIPEFPLNKGPEVFGGKVIHSMDYASMDGQMAAEFVRGKQVTVVGFQKSALDIAMECSAVNGVNYPCTVLYRTEHWNLPDYLPWGIPLAYLYLNRFSELTVHKPGENFLLSLIATLLAPLLRAFGSAKRGILVDGEASSPLKTDLMILATGFSGDKKLKDIFVSSTFQNLIAGSPNATVPLYRECIHPQIPQMAVIGFSESASILYTSELRCRWVAELLDGTFKVPSIEELKKDVEKWDEYMKTYSGQYYRRSCLAALHIWYNDQLCKDMHWNPRRKNGLLAELFEPYGPLDYSSYNVAKGFDPIVFEAKSSIGGVWTTTLDTTKLQTPKPLYQFSDFPWPSSVTQDFPDHHQVLNYITSYAHHFDLLKHIKFNSQVQGIDFECEDPALEAWHLWGGSGTWTLSVKNTQKDSTEVVYTVDFVILCIGRFSDVPNIPEFPLNKGPEVFGGKVIHSMDYASMDGQMAAEFVRGKQVTVVGFQKSALDIAMECSAVNGVNYPCTVLYRTEHWNLPDYLPWGIPLTFLYLNRFSELMVHKPGENFLLSLIATFLAPLRWAFSKFVESHIRRKLGLKNFGMVPNHSFHQEINSCLISTVPEKFYDKVEGGSIVLKKAPRFWFCKEGILVDGEASSPLKTDLVILATGFSSDKKLKDIFLSFTFQNLIAGSPNATVPLYRECIHPQIPQLAVIGFSESVSNLYTSEMRCRWVAELLDGTFKVPSIEEMKKDVEKWDEYMKTYSGQYYRRSCLAALHIWYNDQLCKDMHWNPRRKSGLLAELFEPYGPLDYSS